MSSNIFAIVCFSMMVLCPILIGAGYFMLVRQVWHLPDRKAHLKRIFLSTKDPKSQRDNPKAVAIMGLGGLCGFLSCMGLLAWVFLIARR